MVISWIGVMSALEMKLEVQRDGKNKRFEATVSLELIVVAFPWRSIHKEDARPAFGRNYDA